ncbi:UBP-type zinc finger domain-containing protein [Streptomyces sp. NPDC006879]|uniref:UBP-type zinc finger domain-containing protein n=1 Tax=Streptomyces sp. NPDC006879 TaxID=3364767 RepID=UPI00369ECB06
MDECLHVPELPHPEPAPRAATCPECLARGSHPVQLRMCLWCGHVACCDSSPHRHATAHYLETGHPVMRSFEPGETWRWCYVDSSIV